MRKFEQGVLTVLVSSILGIFVWYAITMIIALDVIGNDKIDWLIFVAGVGLVATPIVGMFAIMQIKTKASKYSRFIMIYGLSTLIVTWNPGILIGIIVMIVGKIEIDHSHRSEKKKKAAEIKNAAPIAVEQEISNEGKTD